MATIKKSIAECQLPIIKREWACNCPIVIAAHTSHFYAIDIAI